MEGIALVGAALTTPNENEDFGSTFTRYQHQDDSSVRLQQQLYHQRRLLQQLDGFQEGQQNSNDYQLQQFQQQHHQLLQDSFQLETFTVECERVLQQYQRNTMDIDSISPIARNTLQMVTLPAMSVSISVEMKESGGLDMETNGGNGEGIASEMELDSAIEFLEIELGLERGQLQGRSSLEHCELISMVRPGTDIEEEQFSSRETDIDPIVWPSISSFSKPFGSLSDIQATALTEEYVFQLEAMVERQDSNETMPLEMEISRTNSSVDQALPVLDALHDIEIEPTYTSSPYYSSTGYFFGSYRSPEDSLTIHRNNNVDSSSSGSNTSSNSQSTGASSRISNSLGLLPASNSPIIFNTTSGSSAMTDGELTSDPCSDGLSFLLSGLTASSGPEGSVNISDRGSLNAPEIGIEPTKVLIGLHAMAMPVGRPLQVSMPSRSSHALMSTSSGKPQLSSTAIPFPIPTRSKVPSLRGWTGEFEKDKRIARMDNRVSASYTFDEVTPGVALQRSSTNSMDIDSSQMRNLKRKRSPETESEDEVDVKPFTKESTNIDKGDESLRKGEHENLEQKRQRKKRRVDSFIPEKGKARAIDIGDSDEESDLESDDDDDVYCPSRSPSPSYEDGKDRTGSSSRAMYFGTQGAQKRSVSRAMSESAHTYTGSEGNSSSSNVGDDGRDAGNCKRSKGKAKGSAALALAKITMLSGKSPTSPWGTYVPFPFEDQDQDNYSTIIDHDIKAGRKRRNGHIPLPVPVPHLIKKSRGRKVPHVASDIVPQIPEIRTSKNGEDWKRGYVCEVPGCGKGFVRGEHLKRHVRSIHTHDKPHPCPYEGCDKSFSRRDNLGQHVRIHLPPSS